MPHYIHIHTYIYIYIYIHTSISFKQRKKTVKAFWHRKLGCGHGIVYNFDDHIQCRQTPAPSGHGISDTAVLLARASVFMTIISPQRHPPHNSRRMSWLKQRLWRVSLTNDGQKTPARTCGSGQQAIKRCIMAYQRRQLYTSVS